MIYLDYSANTPVDPAVLEAFCKAEQMYIGNPNSTHCAGRAACEEMARVTDHILDFSVWNPPGLSTLPEPARRTTWQSRESPRLPEIPADT